MRRLLFFLLYACLLLALCACAPTPPLEPEEPVAEEPQAEQPADIDGGQGQAAELVSQRYSPTATIVPLTNAPRIYSNCVLGEVTFIQAADHSRVELPPGVSSFQVVVAEEDQRSVIAYALLNEDYLMAFLSVDGEMLSDFVYEAFGEDAIHFPNRYGYVTVLRQGAGYRLLNLSNGVEIALPEYEDVSWPQDQVLPQKQGVLALRQNHYQLLDYAGQILVDYGTNPPDDFFELGTGFSEDNGDYVEPLPADLYRRTRLEPSYCQQLEDALGNIIIPFGVYGYILPYPPFIIGKSEQNSDPNFDILNMQGEVLLHNPLGAVVRECGLTDAMVVWLDEKTCVFLHADGSTTPIEDLPTVELVYLGG